MHDDVNSSELWLLRTHFDRDHDAAWTSLTELASSTRSSIPGAALVVSSDRTQCQQRIRRVLTRLATRAEANDGLFVALADKQTFVRDDRTLLTIDCSAVPRNGDRAPMTRMLPTRAFRLGIDEQTLPRPYSHEPASTQPSETPLGPFVSRPAVADLISSFEDAIRSSEQWRSEMKRDAPRG